MRSVKAVFEDGVFRPKEHLVLPEKAEVEVLIPTELQAADDDPTGWKTARELIGCITEELVAPDVSAHPDRYIYRRRR